MFIFYSVVSEMYFFLIVTGVFRAKDGGGSLSAECELFR